jgi:DNA-binding Xre family transcriptional regulator
MPNINIYLPRKYEQLLEGKMSEDETIGGAAKRLLLGLLDGGESTNNPIDTDRLAELESKLEKLETQEVNPIAPDALKEIRDQLEILQGDISGISGRSLTNQDSLKNLVERIEDLEGWIVPLRKFSDRLDALEKKGKVEAAPREIPTGLTHKEMSLICGVAPSVLGKLAKNRDRWPEGYMWSDESKKWFPLEMPTDSVKTAKGLNHQEMAEICGITLYAVTLLIHDRSKWPEGYIWSGESKKWFPLEV